MSASNWAKCPRRAAKEEEGFAQREQKIAAAYGVVPPAEFDAMRARLADDRRAVDRAHHTFREDYEIYGAADGEVRVEYSGACTECGLSLEFQHRHELPA